MSWIILALQPNKHAVNPAYQHAVNEWKHDIVKRENGLIRDIQVDPHAKSLNLILTYENQYEKLTLPKAKLLLKLVRHEFNLISKKYDVNTEHLIIYIYFLHKDEIQLGNINDIGVSLPDKTKILLSYKVAYDTWPTEK
jgi:hypothetical protein